MIRRGGRARARGPQLTHVHPLLPIGSDGPVPRSAIVGALLCVGLLATGCASTPSTPTAAPAARDAAATVRIVPAILEVRDPRLLPALQELLAMSPRVAAALGTLDGAGRIRVHTYESAGARSGAEGRFAYGYTQAYYGDGGRVDSVDVAIQWGRLERAAAALGMDAAELRRDIAVLLGHELFGHAVPLLAHGSLAGECTDVLPGGASCSVARENAVRADLGVAARPDYLLVCLPVTAPRDEGIGVSRLGGTRRCPSAPGSLTPRRTGAL